MSGHCAFRIERLNVWLDSKHVLNDVSDVIIPRNVVFSIMGPSGSGKSTLLKTLNRLVETYPNARVEGKVLFMGEDIFSMDPVKLRRRVGYVFQQPNPFPHMSIYDNIAYPVKALGLAKSKREIDDIVKDSLMKANLYDEVKDRLHAKASALSGGQQQRLVIARALALRPSVLLMDEPTSMIDVVGARKIEELILQLKKEMTVVVATHTPQMARRISDYVLFLYDGRVVEWGPKEVVLEAPENDLTKMYVAGRFG